MKKTKKTFTPLVFLSSLGAGGIAVMPFVMMQYTLEHGAGLITRSQIWAMNWNTLQTIYYYYMEAIMAVFTVIHVVLTIMFLIRLFRWLTTSAAGKLLHDPLANTAILAPFISLLMTMNLFIGPIRYFFPFMSGNFQSLMMPAFVIWSILFVVVISLEIYLLGISFEKGFDINKINFGWLLHPFLLGMLSVVGTGISAMAHNQTIAHSAAFMSMISLSMGLFLLSVKMVMVFASHFAAKGLPEKNFLPSFLIVIPNITLFSLSAFRLGHYLEHNHEFHLGAYFYIVVGQQQFFYVYHHLVYF